MRPVLLVYGNCQAEALVTILQRSRAAELFELAYLRSFAHPTLGRATLSDDVLARCAIVWEQRDYEPFPYADRLPGGALVTVFPSLDINVLWPYTCNNPYNRPEPPEFPFGPYHYGDRVVVAGIRAGLTHAEILDRVLGAWEQQPVDLTRLMEIERARLAARDIHCDIRMGEHILERFTRERCFFTRDHPTLSLLLDLLQRLLERSYAAETRLATIDFDEGLRSLFALEPLGETTVPIHRAVAEYFGLSWYDPDAKYGPRHKLRGYREYFDDMIRSGLACIATTP